jgi:hypothetical protein
VRPCLKKLNIQVLVACAWKPSSSGNRNQGNPDLYPTQTNSLHYPILKTKIKNSTGRVAQVVEHLSSKCEAMNSNPNAATKPNQRKKGNISVTLHIKSSSDIMSLQLI